MADYNRVSSRFWTGETGRAIRSLGERCQIVALYLVTGPNANPIGLYYVPIALIAHETGCSIEGATEALRSLNRIEFSLYDEASETTFVPRMAAWQIGEVLHRKDKRRNWILKELSKYKNHKYFNEFMARYSDPYKLGPYEAPSETLPIPFEGSPYNSNSNSNSKKPIITTHTDGFPVEKLEATPTRFQRALKDWMNAKDELRKHLPEKEWSHSIRPLLLMKVMGTTLLLAGPPAQRVVETFKKYRPVMVEILKAKGYRDLGLTRYPSDDELLRMRREWPSFFDDLAPKLKQRLEKLT